MSIKNSIYFNEIGESGLQGKRKEKLILTKYKNFNILFNSKHIKFVLKNLIITYHLPIKYITILIKKIVT